MPIRPINEPASCGKPASTAAELADAQPPRQVDHARSVLNDPVVPVDTADADALVASRHCANAESMRRLEADPARTGRACLRLPDTTQMEISQ